jgi:hypothetical protein
MLNYQSTFHNIGSCVHFNVYLVSIILQEDSMQMFTHMRTHTHTNTHMNAYILKAPSKLRPCVYGYINAYAHTNINICIMNTHMHKGPHKISPSEHACKCAYMHTYIRICMYTDMCKDPYNICQCVNKY